MDANCSLRSTSLLANSPLYSREEAAAYLNLAAIGVSDPVAGIDRLVKNGLLEGVVMLRHLTFTRDQLDSASPTW